MFGNDENVLAPEKKISLMEAKLPQEKKAKRNQDTILFRIGEKGQNSS